MARQVIGNRGNFEAARYPKAFADRGYLLNNVKQTASEKIVFNNYNHGAGAATSAPFSTNRVKRFSVYTTGSLNVSVEESPTPHDQSSWDPIGNATPTAPLQITAHTPHVRLVTTSGIGSAILFRDYMDGSE